MEEMKFYTEEEALDKVIGEKGTPERNKYEDDINNFLIGEAIKRTRESKNLTQEQATLDTEEGSIIIKNETFRKK